MRDVQLILWMVSSSALFFWINWTLVGWFVDHRRRIEDLEAENDELRKEMEGIKKRLAN